ncbi:hypothetical protein [Streptosporangium sp. CA-115845]|uniref:hypothetical protein n=1 Tax=Streptosporangium sp. CA-115845 TaxID=3240071 RepID=UPI003D901342
MAERQKRKQARRGRLIVLEGPDGIGKTTLAQGLADTTYEDTVDQDTVDQDIAGQATGTAPAAAAGPRLVFVPRRQISRTSPYARTLMTQLATMLWHSGDAPDLPDGFWVTLQASWYSALRTTVVDPVLDAGHDVIMDGWWFKFFSKLLLQGWAQSDLDVIFGRVTGPDAVIVLTADLGTLYDRREDFQPREMGMHAGVSDYGRQAFITYQHDGLKNLLAYADHHGWPVLDLDAAAPVADTLDQVRPLIAPLRRVKGESL